MTKKRRRKDDPGRAERIRLMREREANLRASLDKAYKAGRDLTEHAHSDRLLKDRASAASSDSAALSAAILESRELLIQCELENIERARQCERLEAELDSLEGRQPKRSVETILEQLPVGEAAEIRSFLQALPSSPGPQVFLSTEAHLNSMVEQLAALRIKAAEAFAIAQERVSRGWMAESEVETRKPEFDKRMDVIETEIRREEALLKDVRERHAGLISKRDALLRAIAAHKGGVE
jgi:hypothetical protein